MRFAHQRIVISQVIRSAVASKYACESVLIPNGVTLPDVPASAGALERFGLVAGKYVLLVSRLVPEKRHMDLIEAFSLARLHGWKLVLVGAADHPDAYARSVLAAAAGNEDVVCTGFQSGLALRELYAHAGMFALPSSHEGLPIALLEALSYGLPSIASDIAANREVINPRVQWFQMGNIEALAEQLRCQSLSKPDRAGAITAQRILAETYRWSTIARDTQ
jgi:glycosyltransferase involved in cell wall biosynthesis